MQQEYTTIHRPWDNAAWVQASDCSLLVRTLHVHALLQAVERATLPGIVNLHPAYESLLIVFDMRLWTHESVQKAVLQLPASPEAEHSSRLVHLPVVYDGPDLHDVAAFRGITPRRVVELHSGVLYTVCFMGFLPGFAYLSGLPPELAMPRLESPRPRVEAGSVGIGGGQTGVYPLPSPGGWRIIGRTPVELFRPDRDPASLLRPGDQVRFAPR